MIFQGRGPCLAGECCKRIADRRRSLAFYVLVYSINFVPIMHIVLILCSFIYFSQTRFLNSNDAMAMLMPTTGPRNTVVAARPGKNSKKYMHTSDG